MYISKDVVQKRRKAARPQNQDKLEKAVLIIVTIAIIVVAIAIVYVSARTHKKIEDCYAKEDVTYDVKQINETAQYISLGDFEVTAYCPCEKCCGAWANSRPKDDKGQDIILTASGQEAIKGHTVAVDPKVIPYGTIIVIDGIEYVALDTGGDIKGNRIEILFDEHQQALNYGRQHHDVYIKGRVDYE